MNSIDDLSAVDTRREHLLAILGHELMAGTAVPQGWLQLRKNNIAAGPNDPNIYETDWSLTLDDEVIGYLDTEEKQGWTNDWPYPMVNVAKHPMSHWQRASFNGRPTNKLLSFSEKPDHSWWVAMRKDWQQAVLVNAADLFAYGSHSTVSTAYSDVRLPVIRLRNEHARLARRPEEFSHVIVHRIKESSNASR